MGDKLKQFIDENREAFDSENPDPQLYTGIRRQLLTGGKKGGQRKMFRILGIAASVLLVSVSLYFIFQKKNETPVQARTVPEANTIADPVYAQQIEQYQQVIDLQQVQLKKVEAEHPELYRQFTDDINQLDSAYGTLKTILAKNPNREMLLEAMIRNLQLQTELLTRQLSIIKEIKQKSKA